MHSKLWRARISCSEKKQLAMATITLCKFREAASEMKSMPETSLYSSVYTEKFASTHEWSWIWNDMTLCNICTAKATCTVLVHCTGQHAAVKSAHLREVQVKSEISGALVQCTAVQGGTRVKQVRPWCGPKAPLHQFDCKRPEFGQFLETNLYNSKFYARKLCNGIILHRQRSWQVVVDLWGVHVLEPLLLPLRLLLHHLQLPLQISFKLHRLYWQCVGIVWLSQLLCPVLSSLWYGLIIRLKKGGHEVTASSQVEEARDEESWEEELRAMRWTHCLQTLTRLSYPNLQLAEWRGTLCTTHAKLTCKWDLRIFLEVSIFCSTPSKTRARSST